MAFVHKLFTLSATDRDAGLNAQLRYILYDDIEPGADQGAFLVAEATGEVYLVRQLDRETKDVYQFGVEVFDSGETPLSGGRLNVTITVLDANDNSPVWQGEPYTVSVTENTRASTLLFVAEASDEDIGLNGQVQYTLLTPSVPFSLGRSSGQLIVAGAIDFEETRVRMCLRFRVELWAESPLCPAPCLPASITVTDHH